MVITWRDTVCTMFGLYFFEKFPLGQVWAIETNRSWWEEIWNGKGSLGIKLVTMKAILKGFHLKK